MLQQARPARSASDITREELAACFHLPSEAACRQLGIGLTVLKRQCRKFGIKRWPFRKIKSLDRLISNVQVSPGQYYHFVSRVLLCQERQGCT